MLQMSSFNRESLEYRHGIQAYIVKGKKLFLTQEIHWQDDEWGFPGGKIEEGETDEETLFRELKEEFPKNTFTLLKKANKPLIYEWPDELIEGDLKAKGWSHRGQHRVQFLVELNESEIFEIRIEELKAVKCVTLEELPTYLKFPNQLENTLIALTDFGFI